MADPGSSGAAIPTIGAMLERRALLDAETTAIVAGPLRLTFGQLQAWAVDIAAALTAAGVGKGDRIALLSRNSAEAIALYYAAGRIGAILCNLNIRLAEGELAYILQNAEPSLLIVQDEFEAVAQGLADACGGIRVWVAGQADLPSAPPVVARKAGDAWDQAGSAYRQDAVRPEDPLLLVYTSGTTGKPKGAVMSHATMYWVSATMAYTLDYRYRDSSLIPVPMFHVGGMSFVTFFVHMGATAIVPPAWDPGAILRLIESERVNHFFAVAAMLQGLLDHPGLAETDLSSLRWIMAGGAPVPPELIERFGAMGIPVQQTCGSTETAGPATVVDLASAVRKAGSAGLPFFHTDMRIVDAAGAALPAGQVGEIQVRAPHLFSSYWRNPEATAEAFDGDWYRMGDVGSLDDEGYLWIKGRKKDVIISGGENIYPAEVEAVLETHPAIGEVAVVGRSDRQWGEVPCAVIVANPGSVAPDLAAVAAFCDDKLARYKIPKMVEISAEPLPRNASGKLQKHLLKAKFD